MTGYSLLYVANGKSFSLHTSIMHWSCGSAAMNPAVLA